MSSLDDFSDDPSGSEAIQGINIKLVNDNKRLTEVVASLKAELHEALEFASKNEDLMHENAKLSSDIRISNAKNEDLQHRLEINIKTLEETKNKLAEQKSAQKKSSISDASVVIDKEKKKFQEQIEKINNEISSKEELLQKYSAEKNHYRESLNSIIKLSQEYFNTAFENEEKLIYFLSEAKPNDSTQEIQIPENSFEDQGAIINEKLARKLIKLKKELKQEKEAKKALIEEFEALKAKLSETKKAAEEKINQIKEETANEKHKLSLNEIKLQNEIEKLNNENKRNLQQISLLKEQNTNNSTEELNRYKIDNDKLTDDVKALRYQVSDLSSKLQETKNSLQMAQGQNELLSNQIKTTDTKSQINREKFSKQQKEIMEQQTLIEKLKAENKMLLLEIDKLQESNLSSELKIKAANISTQQCQAIVNESNSEIEKHKKAIEILEENYARQKSETQNVYETREKLIHIIQKQTATIKNMENMYAELLSENKQQKKANKIIKEQIQKEVKKVPPPIEIPVTAWFNAEFPRELCTKITDVAKNDSLSPIIKLNNVLTQVAQFYNPQIKEMKKSIQELKENLESNEETFNGFLSMIGILLHINLTIDILSHDESSSERVKESILKLREEKIEVEKEKDGIKAELSDLIAKLEVQNVDEAKEMIEKLYQMIEKLRKDVSSEKSKVSAAKKVAKAIDRQSTIKISEVEVELEKSEEKIESMEMEIQERINKQKELELEIKKLKETAASVAKQNQISKTKQSEDHNSIVLRLNDEHEKQMERLNATIERKEKEIREQKEKIEKLLAQNEQWKQSSHSFNLIKQQTDEQMKALLEQSDQNEKEIREMNANEKKAIIDQYEKCLADVKKNNREMQKSQEKVVQALNESNAKILDINEKLSLSEKECIDLKNKLKLQNENLERERSIMEMKKRSSLLTQEMKYQNIIDQCKQDFQKEKRGLIDFTATLFRGFFDANYELDEFSYKSMLKNVQTELDRLQKQEESMRSILCINENASICDSVAKLLISVYQTKNEC